MTAGHMPSWDPLGYSTELQLQQRLYPLGFALDLWTNHRDVVEAADESWGGCHKTFDEEPLELRVLVTNGRSESKPAPPTFRVLTPSEDTYLYWRRTPTTSHPVISREVSLLAGSALL